MSEEEIEIRKFKAQMAILIAKDEEKKKTERLKKQEREKKANTRPIADRRVNTRPVADLKISKPPIADINSEQDKIERSKRIKENEKAGRKKTIREDIKLIAWILGIGFSAAFLITTLGLGWTIAIAIAGTIGYGLFS